MKRVYLAFSAVIATFLLAHPSVSAPLGKLNIDFSLQGFSSQYDSIVYSPDGRTILVSGTAFLGGATEQTVLELRKADTMERLQSTTAIPGPVEAEFVYDGQSILTWGQGANPSLWQNLSDTSPVHTFEALNIACADLSPDGCFFAIGTATEPGWVKVFDLQTRTVVNEFAAHRSIVTAISISLKGKYVLTAGLDNTLKVWEVATGKKVRELKGQEGLITSVLMSTHEYRAFTSSTNSTIYMWNLLDDASHPGIMSLNTYYPHHLEISPDNTKLFASGPDVLINWVTGTLLAQYLPTNQGFNTLLRHRARYSPSGDEIILYNRIEANAYDVSTFSETPIESPIARPPLPLPDLGYLSDDALSGTPFFGGSDPILAAGMLQVYSLDISPDGNELLTARGYDGTARWDLITGRKMHVYKQKTKMESARFSRDGKYIVGAGIGESTAEGIVSVWERDTGKRVLQVSDPGVRYVAESLEHGIIASAGWYPWIKIWNAKTGDLIKTIQNFPGVGNFNPLDFYSIDITPDGKRLIAGSSYDTYLMEIETENVLFHGGGAHAILSPDGKYFYTGETVYNAVTGNGIRHFDLNYSYPLNGNRYVHAAAFSPDGKMLAVGAYAVFYEYGSNGSVEKVQDDVQIFDVATGSRIRRMQPVEEALFGMKFSKDSRDLFLNAGISHYNFTDYGYVRKIHLDQIPLEPTSTPSPSPTSTPLPTATPTPIPNTSLAWESIGSPQVGGITAGYGNPIRLMMTADTQGLLTVAWSNLGYEGVDYSYAKQWNGETWVNLSSDSTIQQGIGSEANRLNWLTLDPLDQRPIVSMNTSSNRMRKFNGSGWPDWFGGIDDPDGLEKITEVFFLMDHTPVALYLCDSGNGETYFRARKLVEGQWLEFSPGSATGTGISNDSREGYLITGAVARNGDLYALWEQSYPNDDDNALYMKKWNGQAWVEVGPGSAEGHGIAPEGGWLALRPLILGENDLPIVTYFTADKRVGCNDLTARNGSHSDRMTV